MAEEKQSNEGNGEKEPKLRAPFVDQDHMKPFDRKARPLAVPSENFEEFGYKDPVLATGRWRLWYYGIKEKDPL